MKIFLTVAETLKLDGREFFVSVMPSLPWKRNSPSIVVETTEKGKNKIVGSASLHLEGEKIRIKYLHLNKAYRGETGTRLLLAMSRVLGVNARNVKTVYYERLPQRLSLLFARLKRERQQGKLTKTQYGWQIAKMLLSETPPKVRKELPIRRLKRPR